MKKGEITGQLVVKNEDRFVWYAIAGILPFVSEFFITDTGSTDKTISIIDSFKEKKIKIEKKLCRSPGEITAVRQKQLENSKSGWLWLVDGDEVYPEETVREILAIIEKKGPKLEGIVVGRYDLLGDIYHYQDDSAGFYDLWGQRGHFALRLINKGKIPGLHLQGIYPLEGYYDRQNKEITKHDKDKFIFSRGSLYHAMYLQRSSLAAKQQETFNRGKFKIEKGLDLVREKAPQIFFTKKPGDIKDVTKARPLSYEIAANLLTPLKKIKRRFF